MERTYALLCAEFALDPLPEAGLLAFHNPQEAKGLLGSQVQLADELLVALGHLSQDTRDALLLVVAVGLLSIGGWGEGDDEGVDDDPDGLGNPTLFALFFSGFALLVTGHAHRPSRLSFLVPAVQPG